MQKLCPGLSWILTKAGTQREKPKQRDALVFMAATKER
jgi:hypothetical protein